MPEQVYNHVPRVSIDDYDKHSDAVRAYAAVERLREVAGAGTVGCDYKEVYSLDETVAGHPLNPTILEGRTIVAGDKYKHEWGYRAGCDVVRVTEFRPWRYAATNEFVPASALPDGPPYDVTLQIGRLVETEADQPPTFIPSVGFGAKHSTREGRITFYDLAGAPTVELPVDMNATDLMGVQGHLDLTWSRTHKSDE